MIDFQREADRIFYQDENGNLLAEVTFPEIDGVATIDHTFVDASLRGQGIASMLVEAAAAQIRESGRPLRATCSYAAKWLETHGTAEK